MFPQLWTFLLHVSARVFGEHSYGVFWADVSRSVHVEPLIPENPGFLSTGTDFNLTEVDLSWNEGVKTALKLLPATLACC